MDVRDEASARAGVSAVVAQAGGLDAVVCGAGYGVFGTVEDLPIEKARAQMETNVIGTLTVLRAALPHLRRAQGRAVVVGSLAGRAPIPFQAHYSASKAALDAITLALRIEVAPFGVGVSLVEPGDITTPFNENMDWGDGGESAYAERRRACERVIRESLPKAPGPEVVAEVILRALTAAGRGPLHGGAGQPARSMGRRLLPDWLSLSLIRDHFKVCWPARTSGALQVMVEATRSGTSNPRVVGEARSRSGQAGLALPCLFTGQIDRTQITYSEILARTILLPALRPPRGSMAPRRTRSPSLGGAQRQIAGGQRGPSHAHPRTGRLQRADRARRPPRADVLRQQHDLGVVVAVERRVRGHGVHEEALQHVVGLVAADRLPGGRRRAGCRRRSRTAGDRRRRARSNPRSRARCRARPAASRAGRRGSSASIASTPSAVLPAEEVEEGPEPPRLDVEAAGRADERRDLARRTAAPSASYERRPRARSTSSAFSTFVQAVFCTRMAPTQTSNALWAGHQPACPRRRTSFRYTSCRSIGPRGARRMRRLSIGARTGPRKPLTPRSELPIMR